MAKTMKLIKPKLKNIGKIYIGNILEAFYPVYKNLPSVKRDFWFRHDFYESNRSLLYNHDNKIIITSLPILASHLSHICQLMNWKNVHNLFPEKPSPAICKDLMCAKPLHHTLVQIIKDNPGVSLIPYRSTPEFYNLIEKLQKKHLKFTTPETVPFENQFIPAYCNTKRSFRHLWGKATSSAHLPIDIPEGFIVGDKKEAIAAAWWFHQQKLSFVIKHNRSAQGSGVIFFQVQDSPDNHSDFTTFMKKQLSDKIWADSPIVVEEFIQPDYTSLGGSPSVEFYVSQSGKVEATYAVEQLMEKDHKTFKGCYIHPQLFKHPFIKTAFQAGILYGKELARLGYCGYFDMDLVVGKNGKLYAVETNLRRTGGTHVHETAINFLGKNYLESFYVLSEDIRLKQSVNTNYDSLFQHLSQILFNPKTKTGLIFGNPDMIQIGILHAIFLAPSEKLINETRKQATQLLSDL